ncbi:NKG2-C type II integral membrane protein-like [Talpa occidentalis]|uniref:NKG2-C type II integral membrane protein-like n=1 Tax=Talpa occidentalis TaxID=50954 RepID=UPI00188EBD4F|nr:NKG2-C type II integral membrane protein-like [Talpa occidentalis]
MNEQRVTYAEMKQERVSKKRQVKPKESKISTTGKQQGVNYAESSPHNAAQDPQENGKSCRLKDIYEIHISFVMDWSPPQRQRSAMDICVSISLPAASPLPPGQIAAEVLGIVCLVLVSTIVKTIVLILRHHCGPCAKEWLTYSNSCYYISPEKKTWNESLMACAANNSHLLYIDNQEEMNFLKIFYIFPWIGVSRRTSGNNWVWTNGLVFSSKLLTISASQESQGKNCAYFNIQDTRLFTEYCSETKKYVCKHRVNELT